eukprot:gene13137-14421_t
MTSNANDEEIRMKPMSLFRHTIAYVTLGLLCGWYYFIFLLYPTLIILALRGSYVAGSIFAFFLFLTYVPLSYEPWEDFMYCWIWGVWKEYFDFTYDDSSIKGKLKDGERYIFFEFPHGIFPMGQVLSASHIRDITPGKMICGSSADAVFMFPVMRQIMSWIGTKRATKENFAKTFEEGNYAAVIPGGIAEMYLVDNNNKETESVYFKSRYGTVKMALQQGAHIAPVFFFGNTKILSVAGGNNSLAKLSRKLKASIVFFYGRNYLPVPYRHPLRMVFADIVEIKKTENPTEEQIREVMERVMKSVNEMYDKKRPAWETRKLVFL